MNHSLFKNLLKTLCKSLGMTAWRRDERGTATVEAVLVFPVMMVMFLGAIDTGNALLTNKKVITASQVVADLLSRDSSVTDAQIDDAITAGRLALQPFDDSSYGIDIVGIRFENEEATPTAIWRETRNMSAYDAVIEDSDGLGDEGEGVLAVTVVYDYHPFFGSVLTDSIEMRETAIVRGRDNPFISRM